MNCPCGSEAKYDNCCGPFLSGNTLPDTAEKLMRSRYTAITRADIKYIEKTTAAEGRKTLDLIETKKWATENQWKSLTIIETQKGGPGDDTGVVEFTATFENNGQGTDHHEVSQFRKADDGKWLYVDGHSHTHKEGEGHHHGSPTPVTFVRENPKTGRNDPCPCGSGKKHKKCCMGK